LRILFFHKKKKLFFILAIEFLLIKKFQRLDLFNFFFQKILMKRVIPQNSILSEKEIFGGGLKDFKILCEL